jgi:type 1 glutamine amidotransferase
MSYLRCAGLLLLLAGGPAAFGQTPQSQPKIQALIITGQNNHDWRATTPVLRKLLEDTGRYEVRVTEDFRGAGPETLAPYDVVIVNYYDGRRPELRWGARADQALLDFVAAGKGLVLYHFSLAAFDGWGAYEKLSGGNWRPNNGHHSARHDFTVKITDPQDPIVKGLGAELPQPNDELYANLRWQPKDTYHVLATAWDDHSLYRNARQPTPGPGLDHPMLWTLTSGKGRVFVTALGHDPDAMKSRIFVESYLRGTEWAATGHVSRQIVFDGSAEQTWSDPDLPKDWSAHKYLVMELRLFSPQRFDLRVHDASGVRAVRLAPVANRWIRAVVPLSFMTQPAGQGHDLASVHNKARPMIFINLSGQPGPLTAVKEVGVAMSSPVGKPALEIRSMRLANEDPGDALLEGGPVVDEFGQWIPDSWPGKVRNLDALREAWDVEQKALAAGSDMPYCKYGGYKGSTAKATGFFRVEKIAGKWWIVDPDGHYFLSIGADSINAGTSTPIIGRESLFAAMPPATGGRGASFYAWNLDRRYGKDWGPKWVDVTLQRMMAWGFNTVGNWSDTRLGAAGRVPYVVTTRGWGIENGPMGVADVYAPDFAQRVDRAAADQCASHKDDPFLLGYFLGNEPPWPGRESVAVDAILAGPATPLQAAAKKYLAAGDTPERRKAFLVDTYVKFVETISAAVRKHDPNHQNLGLRFGSSAPPEIVKASKLFDVYSLNSYGYTVNQREVDKVRELIDRPILIGEFHFGTPGRGMTPGLRQTANQEERGVAYRYYVENALADPNLVGAHWFEWVDEPSTGRFDGENYNIGLLDVTDRPYRELVEAAKTTHRQLMDVHAGKTPPATRQAKTQ